ncbi:MAG: hypothetical protein FJ279_14695 [Planctomycetes bacterium]|nr:hypothetical protein [Planctomycetota bacterium]
MLAALPHVLCSPPCWAQSKAGRGDSPDSEEAFIKGAQALVGRDPATFSIEEKLAFEAYVVRNEEFVKRHSEAHRLFSEKRYKEFVESGACRELMRKTPGMLGSMVCWHALASAYRRMGDGEASDREIRAGIEAGEKIIQDNPGAKWLPAVYCDIALLAEGLAQVSADDIHKLVKCYRVIVQARAVLLPRYKALVFTSWFRLGRALHRLKDTKEARDEWIALLAATDVEGGASRPRREAMLELIRLELAEGNRQQASDWLKRLTDESPRSDEAKQGSLLLNELPKDQKPR